MQIPKLPQTSKIIFAVIYSSVALHEERCKLDGGGASASVNRFGEISPLWQKGKSIEFFEGLFNIWQNCETILATFYAIGQKFIVVKGPNIVKII